MKKKNYEAPGVETIEMQTCAILSGSGSGTKWNPGTGGPDIDVKEEGDGEGGDLGGEGSEITG